MQQVTRYPPSESGRRKLHEVLRPRVPLAVEMRGVRHYDMVELQVF